MRIIRSRKYTDAAPVHASALGDAMLRHDVAAGAGATILPGQIAAVPESKYLSDEDVWRAFQNGEDAAFNMLYARYADRLYSYLRFLLIGSPRHLDDIFQEAWITVFKSRNESEPTDLNSFTGWLFRVAHNLAISQVRRDSKTIGIDDLDIDSDLIEGFVVEGEQEKLDVPNSEEIMQHVMLAVEELPIMLREVFVLSEFDRLTLEQIAQMLGISRTNAKVRLFRARKVIRERLAKLLDIS
jgi:RNA polymerase sigma-70 factor, ECF subfamily